MRLKTNLLSGLAIALLSGAVIVPNSAAAKRRQLEELPSIDTQSSAAQAVVYASQDAIDYDEVGYAAVVDGDGAISAVHPTLPVPSYVEVTNIDTGRTILLRISDRATVGKGVLLGLSGAAAQQLGVNGGRIAVRVRRTNPPQHEKIALDNGRPAAERLETPPSLLNALRKKLGVAPVAVAVATPVQQKPLKPMPKFVPQPRAGADFSRPEEEAEMAPPRDVRGGDRFIIEDGPSSRPTAPSKPHWVRGAGAPNVAPVPAREPAAVASSYFVQVAAFGVQSRASAVAKQVGGGVVQAGSVWRVRKGPYASEESARWALGQLVAKGYGDARVTR